MPPADLPPIGATTETLGTPRSPIPPTAATQRALSWMPNEIAARVGYPENAFLLRPTESPHPSTSGASAQNRSPVPRTPCFPQPSAPGYEQLTAQLYFPGDAHNDDDIASAVKPELMLDPQPQPDGTCRG